MTREEFIDVVAQLVGQYIFEGRMPGANVQLRVNPATLGIALVSNADFMAEIADNDEAVEAAAAADRPEAEDAADMQVRRNPDFYPVSTLITADNKPDREAIGKVADHYFAAEKPLRTAR